MYVYEEGRGEGGAVREMDDRQVRRWKEHKVCKNIGYKLGKQALRWIWMIIALTAIEGVRALINYQVLLFVANKAEAHRDEFRRKLNFVNTTRPHFTMKLIEKSQFPRVLSLSSSPFPPVEFISTFLAIAYSAVPNFYHGPFSIWWAFNFLIQNPHPPSPGGIRIYVGCIKWCHHTMIGTTGSGAYLSIR